MTLPPGHHVVKRIGGQWPKACGCGRVFSAHEWATLQLVGSMVDDVESLEMRNCPCGSTLAIEVVDAHADTQRPVACPVDCYCGRCEVPNDGTPDDSEPLKNRA